MNSAGATNSYRVNANQELVGLKYSHIRVHTSSNILAAAREDKTKQEKE